MRIDLNCDMGEGFGAYRMGQDEELILFVTSANVACGWHAGDPQVMDRTVRLARKSGVAVGAHPSYPDLLGFGRRHLDCSLEEIRNYVIYQVGALGAFCRVHGVRLTHVKPHGALYNKAAEDERVAQAVMEAVCRVDPGLYYFALAGPKREFVAALGEKLGLRVIYEAFPDRAYTPGGTLVSRKEAGAVIHDPREVAARALKIARFGLITDINGMDLPLQAQTICVHGDNPQALSLVKAIREALATENIQIAPPGLKP
jgi:UPF0271 protein